MEGHSGIIQGPRIKLVPYFKQHVPLYHSWLYDREIQRLTCTEYVTLEEEYEYQKEWESRSDRIIRLIEVDGELIGDINLFKSSHANDEFMWEINVMIVKEEHRGHGYAGEALELLLKEYQIRNVMAKVHKDNQASIKFFKKRFHQVNDEHDVFGNIIFVRYN